jgi:16S rRNA processing protein RimM
MAGVTTGGQASSSSRRDEDATRVLIGRFGAPHGVRGEIRVKSFTADPAALTRYDGLMLRDGRALRFTHMRFIKDRIFVARLDGVTTREAAELLTHQDVFIARTSLPPPQEDEFYLTDLIGLEARAAHGSVIGHVRDVVNYGAGDILDIKRLDGDSILLAFTRVNVPHVDCAGGYVIVELPAEIDGEPAGEQS